ncbi:MAG: hypothetical protein HXY25_10230, partial [Alphaproteobacteria bacterium]|nr:hypothetical protein [Alphaproteobacteria bacterium]
LANALSEGVAAALALVPETGGVSLSGREGAGPSVYALEGTLLRAEGRLRVSARLVETATGRVTWSEVFDRREDDLFAVQDSIVIGIATALRIELSDGEQARAGNVAGTDNLEAWLLAARALERMRGLTPERVQEARLYYTRALQLDPRYTSAMSGLAFTHVVETVFGWSEDPGASVATISALADELLVHEVSRPAGLSLSAFVALFGSDHQRAADLARAGARQSPSGADYAALCAFVLSYGDDPEGAVEMIERAISLSPGYKPWYVWMRARAHRLAGQPGEALAMLEAMGPEADGSPVFLLERVLATSAAGKEREARRLAQLFLRQAHGFSADRWLAYPAHARDEVARSEKALLAKAGIP